MSQAAQTTTLSRQASLGPPPERGTWPAATLAVVVHLVLLLCLSWVVRWRDQPVLLTAQAELWAKLPPQAEPEPAPAPQPVTPAPPPEPPAPPPAPAKVRPEPVKPLPKAEPAPLTKVINQKQIEAEIAAEKKKAKQLADDKAEKLALEAEAARKQKEKDEAEAARKQKEKDEADAARKQKEKDDAEAARKQKEKDDAEVARKHKEKEEAEAARKQKEKDDAEATRKLKEREEAEAARKQRDKEETARKERERQRKDQEERIKKMAKESEIKEQTEDLKKRIVQKSETESTAPEAATNLVAKISDKYAASIQAAIRPNITFTDAVVGNPAVEIHVKLAPDGTIISSAIFNPSGIKSWDTAALRALDKTERLPKDETGRAPPTLVITLRPRER